MTMLDQHRRLIPSYPTEIDYVGYVRYFGAKTREYD
jgi:hypothetical protein